MKVKEIINEKFIYQIIKDNISNYVDDINDIFIDYEYDDGALDVTIKDNDNNEFELFIQL